MLYDNAPLTRAYLHAWQITKNPNYKRIVDETLTFIAREMTHPEGGFYSSLDADSEGEEGKFYVWTAEEIKAVLGDDYPFFQMTYGITEQGNWGGNTVLQRTVDNASLAARFNFEPETVAAKLSNAHSKLLDSRARRIRPGTDDKVLTSWNGLMLATLAEAARVFDGTEEGKQYYMMATRSAGFLLTSLYKDGRLHRLWRENRTISGFFDTPEDGEQLVLRPKDLQDNAIPSGNAMACEALLRLVALTDRGDYRDRTEAQLKLVAEAAIRYPTAFARWLSAVDFAVGQVKQVAVLGEAETENFEALIESVRSEYRPNVLVAASTYPPPENAPHLLTDRTLLDEKPTAYVCEGFVCKQPVTSAAGLQNQL